MISKFLCAVVVIAATIPLMAADQEKPPQTPYGALYAQWKAEIKLLDDGSAELSSEDRTARKTEINSRYTTRFLELAREHRGDDLWLDCLIWTTNNGVPGADFDGMFDMLKECAGDVQNTLQLQLQMSEFIRPRSDRINPALVHISETHSHAGVRGAALFALAARTKRQAEEEGDEQGLAAASSMLERVMADYPDVSTYRGKNLESATELLDDLRSPTAVSKVVPDTQGKTLSGELFDLNATIRGKVAVISFSGHWCGPCVAMHPVQKEILARFSNESVVIVEMNSDSPESLDNVRKKMEADGLNWILVADGSGGPISQQWRIHAWPTYFLVDQSGRIRRRVTGNLGPLLITWVEELLAEQK